MEANMKSSCTNHRARPQAALGNESGSAVVEMALLLSLLFAPLLVGVAEFGRLEYFAIQTNKAAQAAVAYGAQSEYNASQVIDIRTAAQDAAPDLVRLGTTTPALVVSATTSCACSNGTAITCSDTKACVSPASVYKTLQVQTQATIPAFFRLPGLPQTYTLNGSASSWVGMQ
jgi:Flp pilus assembly protein TadG